jgi:hypothetical protein
MRSAGSWKRGRGGEKTTNRAKLPAPSEAECIEDLLVKDLREHPKSEKNPGKRVSVKT